MSAPSSPKKITRIVWIAVAIPVFCVATSLPSTSMAQGAKQTEKEKIAKIKAEQELKKKQDEDMAKLGTVVLLTYGSMIGILCVGTVAVIVFCVIMWVIAMKFFYKIYKAADRIEREK